MKTRPLHSTSKAFTLVEIMTVITIIGMLAAMSFGMFKLATNKAAKKNTIARLAGIQLGIESYKNDNGEYPEALGQEDTTDIGGVSYKVGGARMIYQILTGDGNSAIKGGGIASTGKVGSSGTVYWEEVTPPSPGDIQAKKKKGMVDVAADGTFFMIDGWRKPFQYVKSIKDRNRRISNIDLVHSDADYEVWSFGALDKPLDDPESQKEWIASWGTD